MKKETNIKDYALVDSGNGKKLERFGDFIISRPCSQAVWSPQLPDSEWRKADADFMRDEESKWNFSKNLQKDAIWAIKVADILFKIAPTDFGHLGIFPEQRPFWEWIQKIIANAKTKRNSPIEVLNLFAYSGGSTLAAAKGGASVCHLDASKSMVAWARENAALNQLEQAPVRWIIDDVNKFLQRELRRQKRYDAIILDPPSFGRGNKGEVFKIENDLPEILRNCRSLLSDQPLFILFSCHTPGFSPIVMRHLLAQLMEGRGGQVDEGEMTLTGNPSVFPLPSGTFARWVGTGYHV